MTMRMRMIAGLFLIVANYGNAVAQESLAPVMRRYIPVSQSALQANPANKGAGAALTLPFFEDFTDYSSRPNPLRWADSQAYINNTMGLQPVSRGVATLDALNSKGRPYDTTNPYFQRYGDSLTSQPIDLSTNSATDNIYFSFFYQPQGYGFSPDNGDSLILYFHRSSGGWQKMWAVNGSGVQPFQQVMIPVADPQFFAADFQFRFVNIVSINSNDDVWNVDYIRMRTQGANDTAVNDLAYTTDPTFLLADYTYMPYRQFLANVSGERAATISDSIANHYSTNATINYGYTARETGTGTVLGTSSSTQNFTPYSLRNASFASYTSAPASLSGRVVFENKFYLQSGNPNEPKANDTAIRQQIFDNYLAYDDGTAEKSYYLNLFPTLPGKIAIEYHLNVPDTLRGMAVYFGQQVPTAYNKLFSITVYRGLQGISNGGADDIIYTEDNFLPLYTDSVNGFTVYRFAQPVLLPAGTFYMGTTQPANSGSDSLYIGYDANRIGGNHLYYNVQGANTNWQSSLFSGALMMRPLLGGRITGTLVRETAPITASWNIFPNPAVDEVYLRTPEGAAHPYSYSITDLLGKEVASGALNGSGAVSLSKLVPGMYLISVREGGMLISTPQKLIKQ